MKARNSWGKSTAQHSYKLVKLFMCVASCMSFDLLCHTLLGMEVNEPDKQVIAKPVASRPTSSSFRSFSELLAGAIDGSPPLVNERSETEVSAVRPKMVRPAINRTPHSTVSQAESSETAPSSSSDKVDSIEKHSSTVFRPLAKVVSKATISLLASMGHFDNANQQAPKQLNNRDKDQMISNQPSHNHPQVEQSQINESPTVVPQIFEDKLKMCASASSNADRLSSDGYNWRKYGQKQVKGSEYPRSYFKCTNPNCQVKKKVERSFDGEVAEIVYKGEHNHPKPPLPKRSTSGVQGHEYDSSNTESNDTIPERNGGAEMGFSAGKSATLINNFEISDAPTDYPKNKRRKHGNQKNQVETSERTVEETRILVRNNTEPEITGDGFRWRKYGQKVVKGNPHPRSYYRCTNIKCNVRKHVERALDDPSAFITTYEGKHNHEKP